MLNQITIDNMMHFKLLTLVLVVHSTVCYEYSGDYTTYHCAGGNRFTLHCSAQRADRLSWTRCVNSKCKIIYVRDDSDNIIIQNKYVSTTGVLSGTCTGQHGWLYYCVVVNNETRKRSWGIDTKGVNRCKYNS